MVEEALVNVTAKRLVLEIWAGANPIKARAGVIINPPPTPIMDPKVPAPRPTMIKSADTVKGSSKHGHVSSLPMVLIRINHFLFIWNPNLHSAL